VTASILHTGFGELRSAFLKLAAIIVFSGSLSAIIPYGGLLVLFVYLGLLMWLFGLEIREAIVFAIIFTLCEGRSSSPCWRRRWPDRRPPRSAFGVAVFLQHLALGRQRVSPARGIPSGGRAACSSR
jgi:hypothetical protein